MKEKSNKGLIVVIIILVVALLAVCTFVAYDKGIIFKKKDTSSDNSEVKKDDSNKDSTDKNASDEVNDIKDNNESTVKEVDINSSLVKNLYKKVSPYVSSNYNRWLYDYKDFYSDKATEEEKMRIVGMNLSQNVYADNSGAPSKLNDHTILVTGSNGVAYTREYVDSVYKDIFGASSTLNKDIPIALNSVFRLYYISSLDKYYGYATEGTGGYNGYRNPRLTKAIQSGSELKIYENVEVYDDPENDMVKTSDCEVVYTFKIDSQNNYIFYSRVESK